MAFWPVATFHEMFAPSVRVARVTYCWAVHAWAVEVAANAPVEPTLIASAVATPVPRPEMPVATGSPVAFVRVPDDGVPSAGVTSVGDVAKTRAPEPVSSVTAAARLADDGVARNVATPAARPDTPVEMGKPVALVRTAADGVPRAGVTSVGDVANTNAPEPVSSVTAAARLAEDGVARNVATPVPRPDTPVEIGSPVAFVSVPLDGVPSAPPFTTTEPAVPTFTARAVAMPVPSPATPVETGSPVALVSTAADGVPRAGVVNDGDVVIATLPEPLMVYSPATPALL